MTACGTRSRSAKRVTLPAETRCATETNDAVSIQLKKLLEVAEQAAATRAESTFAKLDRRCAAMEESYESSQRAIQLEVQKLQTEVKRIGEQRMVTGKDGTSKADSGQLQVLENAVGRLTETESKGRAAQEERAFRLQASVAGLVTRIATVEQVLARFEGLERRVEQIEHSRQIWVFKTDLGV